MMSDHEMKRLGQLRESAEGFTVDEVLVGLVVAGPLTPKHSDFMMGRWFVLQEQIRGKVVLLDDAGDHQTDALHAEIIEMSGESRRAYEKAVALRAAGK